MKVEVDLGACRSYAICVGIAPDVFELDDDGVLVVLSSEAAEGDEDRMREAALACPTQAILLTD